MLAEKREKFKKIEKFLAKIFAKLGPSPNQYTLNSVFCAIFSFLFLASKNFAFALFLFLLAGFFDFIDGAVARYKNRVTKTGAYLDTICDRYVEGIILLGFLFLPLPKIFLEPKIWIFLSLFGSLVTTYAKAAAKEKEIVKEELKKGFFGRAERIILISLALFLGIFKIDFVIYPLILLAIFSNLTAIQRIYLSLKSSIAFSK